MDKLHDMSIKNDADRGVERDTTNTNNNEKKLKKYIEKVHSRGIVYLSRLPPHMVCLHLLVSIVGNVNIDTECVVI